MHNEDDKTKAAPLFKQPPLTEYKAKLSDGSEYIFTEHTALQANVLTAESNIAATADEESTLTKSQQAAIFSTTR